MLSYWEYTTDTRRLHHEATAPRRTRRYLTTNIPFSEGGIGRQKDFVGSHPVKQGQNPAQTSVPADLITTQPQLFSFLLSEDSAIKKLTHVNLTLTPPTSQDLEIVL